MQSYRISLLILFSSIFAFQANASDIQIAPIADQSVNLGSNTRLPITVSGNSHFKLSINPEDLSAEMGSGDLNLSVDPQNNLIIKVQTYSQTFAHKKFSLQAKDDQGNLLTTNEIDLTVNPVFLVNVTDNSDPKAPFAFDSDPADAYFRPQVPGLQIIFKNNSSQSFIIHGAGAIEHAMASTSPGQSYLPALITPALGKDFSGYYTIHDIYTPERNAIFNASQIPPTKK